MAAALLPFNNTATMRVLPRREGFTLIELLIVIVIIGILAMIATSLFWSVKDRGLQTSMQSDLRSAATQQELYFSVHNTYAASTADLVDFAPSTGVTLTINYGQPDGWAGVTTHSGLTNVQCGLAVNLAPLASAHPVTDVGIIACTGL